MSILAAWFSACAKVAVPASTMVWQKGLKMMVTLELEPEVESLLATKASANGCDVNGYVRRLIENDVRRERTFDEILAPFRQAVEESGVSDEELDTLFTEARREVWQAKQEGQPA